MQKSMMSEITTIQTTSAVGKQFALFVGMTLVQTVIAVAIFQNPLIALCKVFLPEVSAFQQEMVCQFAKITPF